MSAGIDPWKRSVGRELKRDFAEGVVFVEHVDGAELIEIEAGVRVERGLQDFGAQIDVFGPDERADAAALVALLDLVPPAVDLVAHHGGLFNKKRAFGHEIKQVAVRAGDAGEKFPAGKDADAAGGDSFVDKLLVRSVVGLDALAAEARVDGGEQMLSEGRLGERRELRFIEARLRALRLGVELADGLDLVAEELDAHGAVGLGRVDVEDAAAAGELAGHFDEVHLRVAHAGEVRGEHFNVDLFAAAQGDGKAGVVVAIEEAECGGLSGRDEDGDCAGGELPQGGGALLLHVGMRREIFKGKHVVRGHADDAMGIDGAGELAASAEHRLKSLGGLVVRDDDDDELARGAGKEREIEGASGRGESRDTPTPRTKAEMPLYAIKCGGVLQLREHFADKREDHASSSLAAAAMARRALQTGLTRLQRPL